MAVDEVEWVKYFAELYAGYVREWPSGLLRRVKYVGNAVTDDEVWTKSHRWDRTLFFVASQFGSSDADVPVIEVPETEADLIRQMVGVRPRGGPFTPEGQAWLAEHPDDRAAKYLGVTPPVYDTAGRLVTPMGHVPGDEG